MTQTIIVVRHGNKNGDNLTEKGAVQITTTVNALNAQHKISRILRSDTNRTKQCAEIASTIIGINEITVDTGFNPDKPFNAAYGSMEDLTQFKAEFGQIMAAGNTVATARTVGEYPKLARKHLGITLQMLAAEMRRAGQEAVIAFCHSPYTSLAAPENVANVIPYEIGEADAIIYTIEDGEIVNAEHMRCPLQD